MVAVSTGAATKTRLGAGVGSGDQAMYKLVSSVASEALGIGKSVDVLTVLGGKASCRRKFVFNVHLVDEAGQLVPRDMAIVASVAYAHDRSPVLRNEKPFLAEPPLFTTFNGVEFPAQDRPTRMVSGRASFKLAISLLSSKCDNRLFCICFTPHTPADQKPICPPCYSKPIRSISRKRTQAAHVCVPLPLNESLALLSQDHPNVHTSAKVAAANVNYEAGSSEFYRHAKGGGATTPKSSTESPTSSTADEEDTMTPHEQQIQGSPYSSSVTSMQYNSPRIQRQGLLLDSPADCTNFEPPNNSHSQSLPVTGSVRDNTITQNNNKIVGTTPPISPHLIRPFRPYASVGPCKLPGINDCGSLNDATTSFKVRQIQSSSEIGSMSPPLGTTQNLLERVLQLHSLSPKKQKVDTVYQSFSVGHCGGSDQLPTDTTIEEEEKTLQYLEASLQDVSHELQRRKEELRSKRRRLIEDEARMHSIIIQSSSWIESLSGRLSM